MRALSPDTSGFIERNGIKVGYEVFGDGDRALMLVPPSPITHSRSWKGQIPYLARFYTVITFDGRGSGASDRPQEVAQFMPSETVTDVVDILDAVDVDEAVVVSHCHAALWAFMAAAAHPDRVSGIVAISPGVPGIGEPAPQWPLVNEHWSDDVEEAEGWLMCNPSYWRRGGYENWTRFWFSHLAVEPHSTKLIDDTVGWALETDPETMILAETAEDLGVSAETSEALSRSLQCPVLVLHGTEDGCQPVERGRMVAELTGAEFVPLEGAGHLVAGRDPVAVNRNIKKFVDSIGEVPMPSSTWTRSLSRQKKALYVSSPIGLGHARRDVAIADELAKLNPDLEIEWLAQHPVTTVLEARGHTIHPASRWLANESAHFASEATGHELNAFQALRNMDEILVANFMVFQEVVEEGAFDLILADEAWDIDHFWHENPELKQGSHVWMTDFVGFVPMPEGGEREAFLTADYNAEMVEHVARFPRIRDEAILVGDPDDLVPDPLGPDLPTIRDWTEEHFSFSGYITGFTPPTADEAAEIRAELGYGADEKVCLVTVGGSGVGRALLERVMEAFPYARKEMENLRMVAVTGPRIDPQSVPVPDGVEVAGYVDNLHRHLSVCDLAIVQGGLTTTMELTAARRPFIYFPLRNHFEQNRHVRFRLERHRAGRAMDFALSSAEDIAAAMVAEIARPIDYLPVESNGAARAAELISRLI